MLRSQVSFSVAAIFACSPCANALCSSGGILSVIHVCSFKDKEVQRDAKMVSYKVVDKAAKPYVEVDVAGDKKVGGLSTLCSYSSQPHTSSSLKYCFARVTVATCL